MTPQIVVFDLGKVLVDFDYRITARRIAAQGTLSPEAVQQFIDQSPLLHRFETGLLTNEQFYAEICRSTGFRGPFAEFSQFFADIFWPIETMIEWQARLCAHRVPTYIFSNTNDLAVLHIQRRFPFFANFSGYVYSYQVGVMKPHPKMYEAVERMAGKRGEEILYLDDRAENVEAARARGWQVILHEAPAQTLAAAQQAGLPG